MTHNIRSKALKLSILFVSAALLYTLASFMTVQRQFNNAYRLDTSKLSSIGQDINVAIIFGGGVSETAPLPLVRERLDAGYKLLQSGVVSKLILSGDNRSLDYNEPAVMHKYLTETYNINPDILQADFAGRSTYETCERASKVFNLDKVILVSESTHLPRAIYLCRHFGIEAYGAMSDGQASSGLRIGQRWREILARNKAIFNVYILGESTVLGDPIELNSKND